jgi:transcriptional regulator GlxA family with amidase domain
MSAMTEIGYFLPMHGVVFVVYPGFELLDVSGPAAAFNNANRALEQAGRPPYYAVEIVSASGGAITSSSGITVETRRISELAPDALDTLLVAGAEAAPLLPAIADPELRKCLVPRATKAQRLGSVCSGAFVLAALGLIDGKRVATHWDACAPLAKAFPSISVDPDSLYVVDGRIWTSAGVTTGIDMALAMIASDIDAATAGQVAKRLVLYSRRPGYQSQFSPLLQAQVKAESPFADLIGWIQTHLASPLDAAVLAKHVGLSERTFYRKFLAATGETPARFVESARLDAARMLLSRGLSLKAVAAKTGLSPAARFMEAFERRFGVAPRLFRDMHAELPAHPAHRREHPLSQTRLRR